MDRMRQRLVTNPAQGGKAYGAVGQTFLSAGTKECLLHKQGGVV